MAPVTGRAGVYGVGAIRRPEMKEQKSLNATFSPFVRSSIRAQAISRPVPDFLRHLKSSSRCSSAASLSCAAAPRTPPACAGKKASTCCSSAWPNRSAPVAAETSGMLWRSVLLGEQAADVSHGARGDGHRGAHDVQRGPRAARWQLDVRRERHVASIQTLVPIRAATQVAWAPSIYSLGSRGTPAPKQPGIVAIGPLYSLLLTPGGN